jgi:hypothetical protein
MTNTYSGSYVYEGKEWVLTGREAHRTLPSGKIKKLIEIRPIDVDPNEKLYNRWVEREELYTIME